MNINIEIKKTSYDKLKSMKVWYNSFFKTRITQKDLIDYIFDEFIKYKELDYINMDENNIKEEKSTREIVMKLLRVDNHFDPSIHEKIEAAKEYFENKNNKKTTAEIVDESLFVLFQKYTDIDKILQKNKFIKQQNAINMAKKKQELKTQERKILQ